VPKPSASPRSLIEADADAVVQNSAWVIRDLIENLRKLGRIAFKTTNDSDHSIA
jgi:hypothetical protein